MVIGPYKNQAFVRAYMYIHALMTPDINLHHHHHHFNAQTRERFKKGIFKYLQHTHAQNYGTIRFGFLDMLCHVCVRRTLFLAAVAFFMLVKFCLAFVNLFLSYN